MTMYASTGSAPGAKTRVAPLLRTVPPAAAVSRTASAGMAVSRPVAGGPRALVEATASAGSPAVTASGSAKATTTGGCTAGGASASTTGSPPLRTAPPALGAVAAPAPGSETPVSWAGSSGAASGTSRLVGRDEPKPESGRVVPAVVSLPSLATVAADSDDGRSAVGNGAAVCRLTGATRSGAVSVSLTTSSSSSVTGGGGGGANTTAGAA